MIYSGTYKARIASRKVGLIFKNYDAVINSELAYADIIAVKVDGMTYNIKNTGEPSSRVAISEAATGAILLVRGTTNFSTSVFVMYQR